MEQALEFDAATHTYRVGGVLVPNVTSVLQVLSSYMDVSDDILIPAQERGTAVHRATELDDLDDLDEDSLDPMIVPYLEAWRQFKRDTRPVFHAIEQRVFSKRHWYAGTLDRIATLQGVRGISMLDIKTCVKVGKEVGPQTAAYAEAIEGYRISNRFAVQLRPDGTYRLIPCKERSDWAVFHSALTLYNWKVQHGKA